MTPPGDGLDFHNAPVYKARVKTAPEVHAAVMDAIRNQPQIGIVVAGAVREFSLPFGGTTYVVFYTRRGNDVGLSAIYADDEGQRVEARRQELKGLFKMLKKGGTR